MKSGCTAGHGIECGARCGRETSTAYRPPSPEIQSKHGLAFASRSRGWTALCGVLLSCLVVSGCGAARGEAIAHIGNAAIDKRDLEHRITVLATQEPSLLTNRHALRERALEYLISTRWLMNESSAEGHPVTRTAVDSEIRRRIGSYPGGVAEFHKALRLRGETEGDTRLEIERQLAMSSIDRFLGARERPITRAEVAAYYKSHLHQFTVPERRRVLVVQSPAPQDAQQIMRKAESGHGLAHQPGAESLIYTRGLWGKIRNSLERAIFTAKEGDLVGPITVQRNNFVFELIRIVPGHSEPLATVESKIARTLTKQKADSARAAFFASWRKRWARQTICARGYASSECKERK